MAKTSIDIADQFRHTLPSSRQKASTVTRRLLVAAVTLLLFVTCISTFHSQFDQQLFNCSHSSLSQRPAGGLSWTSCGEHLECSKLKVPIDYSNASSGAWTLAVARIPATNSIGRIGTMLVNPGGPGGSGISFLERLGQSVSEVVEGKYDIASWDPRGVNGSEPRINCFETQTEQDLFRLRNHQVDYPDTRNVSDPVEREAWIAQMRLVDAGFGLSARLCLDRHGELLEHVNTMNVVRDLESVYNALEGPDTPINYWGFSYGTLIGSYFVNMLPHRVGRVVIDAVVNPIIWSHLEPNKWTPYFNQDTEATLSAFYDKCAEAGSERCALAKYSDSARQLSVVVDRFLSDLYEKPLPVFNGTKVGVLTSGMVKARIFTSMYKPRSWPDLASDLAAALAGDGAPVLQAVTPDVEMNTTVPASSAFLNAAVICTDTPTCKSSDPLMDVIEEQVKNTESFLPHFGTVEATLCYHWPARARERYTGPFNRTLANKILVIGNTADPVTPLASAKVVRALLNDSSLLIHQDSPGHGSLALASLCTATALREYFTEGTLPTDGLVCQPDEDIFPPVNMTSVLRYEGENLKLLENVRTIGEGMEPEAFRGR